MGQVTVVPARYEPTRLAEQENWCSRLQRERPVTVGPLAGTLRCNGLAGSGELPALRLLVHGERPAGVALGTRGWQLVPRGKERPVWTAPFRPVGFVWP